MLSKPITVATMEKFWQKLRPKGLDNDMFKLIFIDNFEQIAQIIQKLYTKKPALPKPTLDSQPISLDQLEIFLGNLRADGVDAEIFGKVFIENYEAISKIIKA